MLNKIIHFSLQNRILVLVASVLLLIGGTYTAFHTEVDVFPDLNAPTVVIMTEANGMAAEEVEQLVTFPVETAVNGATHVRRVRSSSTNGFSVVWVEFEWDTDIYLARQIVSEKLSLVSEELPENVGKPTMGPQSSILGELLIIGLTSDTTSMLDLRTLADWTIRPRLLSTGGVAQVAVLGGDIKEYQVLLDPARMKHYNVTLAEVMNVTRNMNQNANGGVIYEYGNEYIVRGVLSSHDVDQLSRSVIKTVEGVPVTLEDIADVKIGSQEPKLGTASERGKPAVLLTVTKQPKTGTIELTEQLEAALKDLQKNLPADVHVSTDIFRQSRFIESSIGNVKDSLYEGAVFVVIVLFLLLYTQFKNAAQSGVILLNLPLALIGGVFALMITTGEISIPAIIGFISLFGIATRNGMLLISHYNMLRTFSISSRTSSLVRTIRLNALPSSYTCETTSPAMFTDTNSANSGKEIPNLASISRLGTILSCGRSICCSTFKSAIPSTLLMASFI
jgi:Cu/Ag efflux pump CusA